MYIVAFLTLFKLAAVKRPYQSRRAANDRLESPDPK
jgi:hypothetical protein